jgi:hypothetical protein
LLLLSHLRLFLFHFYIASVVTTVNNIVFLLGQTFGEASLREALSTLPYRVLDIEGRPRVQVSDSCRVCLCSFSHDIRRSMVVDN